MDATKWFVTNRRSRFNPLLDKANRTMPQYTFDDIVDCMESYHQARAEEEAQERYNEGYEFLDLDETAKLVKGHTLFETTYNNMVRSEEHTSELQSR